ncbi:MAG: phage tail protein, partial [Oscillospiraceae bacterium]
MASVAAAAAAGLAAAATAFAGIATKALNLGGELEQNLGGAEAVFGNFAEGVKKKADDAYKNMGLSASDFLATANQMGALFQGSGFGIEESADLSTKAMQRAADVASIMGIDVNSAMQSIAGAAKGNFTMMDNLGVAMNDTSLGAYAMSKGIEKSTSQMTQQEKVALAMEMFLDKTA